VRLPVRGEAGRVRERWGRCGNSCAAVADHPSIFERIFDDDVTVCIWNRAPDPILATYLRKIAGPESWERRARVEVTSPEFEELLTGFQADVGRVRWVTELTALVDLFATLTDARTVGLRITAADRATCPRFHCDQVGLRMLCCWVGEGTEWLTEEDVLRDAIGPRQSGVGFAAGAVRPGGVVRQMRSFAVGAFKGDLWPGNEGRGAVHRSPQPEGWRVFVSLDELC
jgi:hypothetical protein